MRNNEEEGFPITSPGDGKKRSLDVIRPGLLGYDPALALQTERHARRAAGDCDDALFLLEHEPVITLGKRADTANILASQDELEKRGVILRKADRGGDVTFHGPGQIVGYPVIGLSGLGMGVKDFVVTLEEALIAFLDEGYGISAEREEGKFTGIWTGRGKVAAIGIRVSRGVTMHGFALNANTDLSWFGLINPCGIRDRPVTSMREILGRDIDMAEAMDGIQASFREAFAYA